MRCFTEQCVESRFVALIEVLPFILWGFWAYISRDYIKNKPSRGVLNLTILILILGPLDLYSLWPIVVWGYWAWLSKDFIKFKSHRWLFNSLLFLIAIQIS